MSISVSFIIPALNEQNFIAKTLTSIRNPISNLNIADVVVVDNGSEDATVDIAKRHGAKVFIVEDGPVGRLRNHGVSKTSGGILIFIDADITLTDAWHKNISKVLKNFSTDRYLVTGSHCLPPSESNFLNKYWFSSFEGSASSHLGSAHLIMTKELFQKVDGFTESLVTGEDYDICMKAIEQGGHVEENSELKVIHNDFPKGIFQFIARESWHGMGDLTTLRGAMRSKVVAASVIFLLLNISLIWSITKFSLLSIAINVTVLFLYLTLISFMKFGNHSLKVILVNAGIYYLYFTGRVLSFSKRLLNF